MRNVYRMPSVLLVAAVAGYVLASQGCNCGGPPDKDDGGVDAGNPCLRQADNTPCQNNGTNGLCKSEVCTNCIVASDGGTGDDSACSAAYGAQYLCIGGVCAPGNCRTSSQCPAGQICGLSSPNICAPCATDMQCQSEPFYGAGTLCNRQVDGGACVSSACATPRTSCNGTDAGYFCCAASTAGADAGNVCRAGNCCSRADCALGNNCINNVCTPCTAVNNGIYYVDPVNGSDNATTGSSNCPYRSLSQALVFLGTTLSSDVTVNILPGNLTATTLADGGMGNGEIFPITIPTHVHVVGNATNRPVVEVPAGRAGIRLSAPNSSLSSLIIDGSNGITAVPSDGIVAPTGSASTTEIDHVTVRNMTGAGISVQQAGVLKIKDGVVSTGNGRTVSSSQGLLVRDTATAIIDVPSGDQTSFNNNDGDGITVTSSATLFINGAPGTLGSGNGTVVANGNTDFGLSFVQSNPAPATTSNINGLVVWGTTPGSAVEIGAGSNIRIRNSYFIGNDEFGIVVRTANAQNDTTKIDLGTDTGADAGRNVLQAAVGFNPNSGAGICLLIDPSAAQTLNARGNIFSGPTAAPANGFRDCTKPDAGALVRRTGCFNGGDIGNVSTSNNVIRADTCTVP